MIESTNEYLIWTDKESVTANGEVFERSCIKNEQQEWYSTEKELEAHWWDNIQRVIWRVIWSVSGKLIEIISENKDYMEESWLSKTLKAIQLAEKTGIIADRNNERRKRIERSKKRKKRKIYDWAWKNLIRGKNMY